jgi:pimeloyl-ACP methyl ester carboxylesterase
MAQHDDDINSAAEKSDAVERALEFALTNGDTSEIRSILLSKDSPKQKKLSTLLGEKNFQQLSRSAQRRRSGAKKGTIILIPGIMGSSLSTRDAEGKVSKVWVHVANLIRGRLKRLEIGDDGQASEKGFEVFPSGLDKDYVLTIDALNENWKVVPFAYDWRLDIDSSAVKLNDLVSTLKNSPVLHIVAHSMGGLVARRFIQMFPSTWDGLLNPATEASSGLLVTLGTPHNGSLSIMNVLRGADKVFHLLNGIDCVHSGLDIRKIIRNFTGAYQLLPQSSFTPTLPLAQLFDAKEWDVDTLQQKQFDLARGFHDRLAKTPIDAKRLRTIIGHGTETPEQLEFTDTKQILFKCTEEGDGRVTAQTARFHGSIHYKVDAKHGDIQSNPLVLNAITKILTTGDQDTNLDGTDRQSTQLEDFEDTRPRRATARFIALPMPAGERTFSSISRRGGTTPSQEQINFLSQLGEGWTSQVAVKKQPLINLKTKLVEADTALPTIKLRIVWGDICNAHADAIVTGHYEGMMPQRAVAAIDNLVSGKTSVKPQNINVKAGDNSKGDQQQSVIGGMVKRSTFAAKVGSAQFFPIPKSADVSAKIAVIAGMGYYGSFGRGELRRLSSATAQSMSALPDISSVATTLIGSGKGNLPISASMESLISGIVDAIKTALTTEVNVIQIVEINREMAGQMLLELTGGNFKAFVEAETDGIVQIDIDPELGACEGGRYDEGFAAKAALTAFFATAPEQSERSASAEDDPRLKNLLPQVDQAQANKLNEQIRLLRKKFASGMISADMALHLSQYQSNKDDQSKVSRVSVMTTEEGFLISALDDRSVIPERFHAIDFSLLNELTQNMITCESNELVSHRRLLAKLVIPREFRETLGSAPKILFEVDRQSARVPWEAIDFSSNEQTQSTIVGSAEVTRQLRTNYSSISIAPRARGDGLRCLVIGDPASRRPEFSLPGARREAIEVAKLLSKKGVSVTLMLGAQAQGSAKPTISNAVLVKNSRLELLKLLDSQPFDLLHYCGHGSFDPNKVQESGWIFDDGVFSARELGKIDFVPRHVFANACLSAVGAAADTRALGPKFGRRIFQTRHRKLHRHRMGS